MDVSQDLLLKLARRVQQGDLQARQPLRQELEERLVPLIRCAMRSGSGLPALVKWVRGRIADLTPAGAEPLDPRQAAPCFARLLCAGLVRDLPVRSAMDTIRAG